MDSRWKLIEPETDLTYRVQGLPHESNRDTLKTAIDNAFSLQQEGTGVQVHSFADDSSHESDKVATITASALSRKLTGSHSEWIFEVPRQSLTWRPEDSSVIRISIDTHFNGFTTLFAPQADEHTIDCIALSGLNGNAFECFKAPETSHMWLRDDLPDELSGARVLLYGYDTRINDRDSLEDLEGLASRFRRALSTLNRGPREGRKPIIFIAHSLGGLLLKEAFVQMSRDEDTGAQLIIQSTYAMLLFGCPNRGMDVATLMPMCQGEANKAFILGLTQNSGRLRQICRDFPQTFMFPDSRIVSFYETRFSPTAIKQTDGTWSLMGPHAILVNEASATHGRPGENEAHDIQAINNTHSEMVKFGIRDVNYQLVAGFLQEFAALAPHIIRARLGRLYTPDNTHLLAEQNDQEKILPSEELLRWLAPRGYDCDHYEDDLFAALSSRHPNTCDWIYRKYIFKAWLSLEAEPHQAMLWLHAIPGAGKTVLSSQVIDGLLSKVNDGGSSDGHQTFYFFFNNADNEKNTPLAAIRALVHQLLQSTTVRTKKKMIDELEAVKIQSGQSRALNYRSLWRYFSSQCKTMTWPIIVLDALDECEQVKGLITELHALMRVSSVRLFVTSRREVDIIQTLDKVQSITMGPEDIHDDIQSYLEYQISQSPKLSNALIKSRVTRILNLRSNGMFLWVVLMLEELKFKQTLIEIEDMLAKPLPQNLHGVYARILFRLDSTLKSPQKTLCRKILKWVTLSKRPLQLSEIDDVLKFEYVTDMNDTLLIHPESIKDDLQRVCGSIVTFRNQTIQLIHLSTREFLLSEDASNSAAYFSISLHADSLQIARICILYISKVSNPNLIDITRSREREAKFGKPFLQYSCLNWLNHVIEIQPERLVVLESVLLPFITTQRCLMWIELCLSLASNYLSQLAVDIQSLIYWSSSKSSPIPGSTTIDCLDCLHYWASSCQNLLTNYGLVLQDRPFEIYSIDPKCMFPPSQWQIHKTVSKSKDYDHHFILDTKAPSQHASDLHHPSANRCLQVHTSSNHQYALFYLNKSNNAFVTVDHQVDRLPRLYCQEATSGRRLPPVCDTEFGDELETLQTLAAARSQDGMYVGIIYRIMEASDNSIYVVVWRIHENLDFDETRPQPWAHKIISHFVSGVRKVNQVKPMVFDTDDHVYCPSGCYNLLNGVEKRSFIRLHRPSVWDISFSGDCSTVVRCDSLGLSSLKRISIEILSSSGEWREIVKFDRSQYGTLVAISHSGRFIIYYRLTIIDDESYEEIRTLIVFDIELQKETEMAKVDDRIESIEAAFYNDDSLIVCFMSVRSREIEVTVNLYGLVGSKHQFYATRKLIGRIAGQYFDESVQHLYLVSKDRVWSRLDVTSKELRFVDSSVEASSDIWEESQLSSDGQWLALLRKDGESYDLQKVALDDFRVIHRQTLSIKLPSNSKDSPLKSFSPNLDWLFVANSLVYLESCATKTIELPFSPLYGSRLYGGSGKVKFSRCGRYIAVAINDLSASREELHIYAIDGEIGNSKKCYHVNMRESDDYRSGKFSFDMHPEFPEIVTLRQSGRTHLEIIDLRSLPENAAGLTLMNGEEPLGKLFHKVTYSPCGNYVFAFSDLPDTTVWEIPGRVKPPSLSIPRVLHSLHRRGGQLSLDCLLQEIWAATGDKTFRLAGDFPMRTMPILTPIPKKLVDTHVFFVIGHGEDPDIKILFLRHDAPPEMKCLRMRLKGVS